MAIPLELLGEILASVPSEGIEPKIPALSKQSLNVKITVKLADKTFVGEGATTLKALQAVPKPVKIVSKGFVTIEYDGRTTERFFRPQQMNRIFYSSPKLQEIHAKNLSLGLIGVKIS